MIDIQNPTRSQYKQRNKNKMNKYEEVICKSILAYEIFFKNFLLNSLNRGSLDLRTIVNKTFEQEGFDGYDVFAKLIISAMYESQGQGDEKVDFLPTNIEKDIDPNVEKKFLISTEI